MREGEVVVTTINSPEKGHVRLGTVGEEADLVERLEAAAGTSRGRLIVGLATVGGHDKGLKVDENVRQMGDEDLPDGVVELEQF